MPAPSLIIIVTCLLLNILDGDVWMGGRWCRCRRLDRRGQGDVVHQGSGGVEVLVGDVAAHGEEYHQGAEHGDRAARADHTNTHKVFSCVVCRCLVM